MAFLSPLKSIDELLLHISDSNWVIIDCRFDLKSPDWGYTNYFEGHIPRAYFAHMDHDLAGTVTEKTGRHPLPDENEFMVKLSGWGISRECNVIVYDANGGSYAARLWWLLRAFGFPQSYLLDGDYLVWKNLGHPVEQGINLPLSQSNISARLDKSRFVSTAMMETLIENPAYIIIDARSAERYRGELEPIDPVAGHIPGAVNRFHGDNLQPSGHFKTADILKMEFQKLIQGHDPEYVIVYCGSGVSSCHHILAMEAAGLPGVKLYPGSWSEWIRDPSHKIASS